MSSQEPAVIARVAGQNPTKEIEPKFTIAGFEVGVGMRKNDEALAEYVNGWVKTNLGNGKLNEIYKRFHDLGLSEKILPGNG